MAKNLRYFNTNVEYQAADLVFPSVSYVEDINKVIYDAESPTPSLKWKATNYDGSVVTAQCDASSAITNGEINKTDVETLEIGDCVTSIEDNALSSTKIKNLTIGSGVTYFGKNAVRGNNYETIICKAVNPPSLYNSGSVGNFGGLQGFYVPCESVHTYRTTAAFNSFSNIILPIDENNECDVIDYKAKLLGYDGRLIAEIPRGTGTTGQNITSAETANYSGRTTNVTFGDCFCRIQQKAFYNYSYLEKIDIPSNVVFIGNSAFTNCSLMTTITGLENYDTYLADYVFYHCKSLKEFYAPKVNAVGKYCFTVCSAMTSCTLGDISQSIGQNAFEQCSSLKSFSFGNVTKNIQIGEFAFYGCYSLESIDIPSKVTSIGNYAFYGCSGLTSITVEATTPPTLGYSSSHDRYPFDSTNNCPIYVPCESIDAYKAATGWSRYSSRIQAIPNS